MEVKGLPSATSFKGKLDCNVSFYWLTKHIASKMEGGERRGGGVRREGRGGEVEYG